MPRLFKDLIVDEGDRKARVNLVNRDGTVALHEVSVELASPVAQQGDRWGAKEANLLLKLGDDGVPYPSIPEYESRNYTVTIGTGWVGDAPCTQKVTVAGITENDDPIVDIVINGSLEAKQAQLSAWGMVSRISTYRGGITVECLGGRPEVAMTIKMKVVR